jgi:hypothetical protein
VTFLLVFTAVCWGGNLQLSLSLGFLDLGIAPLIFFFTGMILLFMPVNLLMVNDSDWEAGRALLRAKPLPIGLPAKAWGTVVGVVTSPTTQKPLLRRRTFTPRTGTRTMKTVGSEGNSHNHDVSFSYTECSQIERVNGPLELVVDGQPIDLELARAPWASARATLNGDEIHRGDQVLVVGRVRREGDRVSFAVNGPGSLYLFAAPENPRMALKTALRRRRLGGWSIIGLSLFTFILMILDYNL